VPALSGGLYSEAFASLLRALLQKEPAGRCAHSGTCRYSGVLWGALGVLYGTLGTCGYLRVLCGTLGYSEVLYGTCGCSGVLWGTLGYSGVLWAALG
jgi:hypothetical protein